MARKVVGVIKDGVYYNVASCDIIKAESPCSDSMPSIIPDSMPPLRHPVSGHVFESKSAYLRETERLGLQVVGNDKRTPVNKDKLTEKVILDRIERAEAIHSDPFKYRQRMNENLYRIERAKKILGWE